MKVGHIAGDAAQEEVEAGGEADAPAHQNQRVKCLAGVGHVFAVESWHGQDAALDPLRSHTDFVCRFMSVRCC